MATVAPSTPPARSSSPSSYTPAKRRRLRRSATLQRFWQRTRWAYLQEADEPFDEVRTGAKPAALSEDDENALLRNVIADPQHELFQRPVPVGKIVEVPVKKGVEKGKIETVPMVDSATTTEETLYSASEVECFMQARVEALLDARLGEPEGPTKKVKRVRFEFAPLALPLPADPPLGVPLVRLGPRQLRDALPAPSLPGSRHVDATPCFPLEALAEPAKPEVDVQKTSEAELPFLKGIEVLAATVATTAIANCGAAASTAQKGITDARTFVVQKLVEAKQFSDAPAESCTKELLGLQKKLDAAASKLAELKKDTTERERKTQMQASGEKSAGVEAAVQGLAATLAKLSDAKLAEISAEDARSVCEEIAQAEHGTQAAVADARKFLAQRLQDAKGFSETVRGPITKDLSKLQSRLTQCQVELPKLSKQCTEREVMIDTMAPLTEAMVDPTALPPPEANIASELLQSEPERYSTCVLCGGLGLNPYTVNVEEAGESEHEELYGCEAECGTWAHVGCIEAGGPIKPKRHTRFKRYRSGWVEQGPGIFCSSCW